jgi:O-acetyl-ADP-ribose deacetylase (regulator of RNase III)
MIRYLTGNIFETQAAAIVNTVNTVGVMGKGIALQFKKAFPSNFKAYQEACQNGELAIGKLLVHEDQNIESGRKLIVNFPTKKHWSKPSEYAYIEAGLDDLLRVIERHRIQSIALPPLGAGNGGLEWEKVKQIMVAKLQHLEIDIFIYEPTAQIKEAMKKERVPLTEARALLLYVLFHLVKQGEYVSEFSSEKVCYFLQKFGAKKYFKLEFTPQFYGPYSGKVRYVLNRLNGSYLLGYSDMDKKPFAPLMLMADGYEDVREKVEGHEELSRIAHKTIHFLDGFYSDFALELLSSVDYIVGREQTYDKDLIMRRLEEWSDRKRTLFSDPKYLELSVQHLQRMQ